jgi:hypothetical protein
MGFEFANIADPPDMIADAIGLHILPVKSLPDDRFAEVDSL